MKGWNGIFQATPNLQIEMTHGTGCYQALCPDVHGTGYNLGDHSFQQAWLGNRKIGTTTLGLIPIGNHLGPQAGQSIFHESIMGGLPS